MFFERNPSQNKTQLFVDVQNIAKSFIQTKINNGPMCIVCKHKHQLKDCLPLQQLDRAFKAMGSIHNLLWMEAKLQWKIVNITDATLNF